MFWKLHWTTQVVIGELGEPVDFIFVIIMPLRCLLSSAYVANHGYDCIALLILCQSRRYLIYKNATVCKNVCKPRTQRPRVLTTDENRGLGRCLGVSGVLPRPPGVADKTSR